MQEQWQKKKQTKDQAKAAKLAKFNPDNARSAKDLLDEREAEATVTGKRKRDDEDENEEDDREAVQLSGMSLERPLEGLKRKKIKKEPAATASIIEDTISEKDEAQLKLEKANEKAQRKQLKAERRKEKIKEKNQVKQAKVQSKKDGSRRSQVGKTNQQQVAEDFEDSEDDDEVAKFDAQDLSGPSPATPSSKAPSPSFDQPSTISGTSSISSITTQNASTIDPSAAKKPVQEPPSLSQEELRARLQARISELRQARRADGADDKPARSRTELIEQRRKKAEQKKANKKALRAQAREEERRQRNEALARGSPHMTPSGAMSPAQAASPLSEANNFSFSRMAFDNGQFMSANLSSVLNPHKKATSTSISKDNLESLEKRQIRLSNMTPEQRASAEEKDMWLNARKRAQGERIKDDTSLLKKALKRQDNKKKKSTKDWNDRITGVANSQAIKQKRREGNLAKRKEDKGNKGNKSKKSSGKGKKNTKARPGFEGSFKTGGGKRK